MRSYPGREKRNFTPVTPKFLKFNRQKLEVPKVSGQGRARYRRDAGPGEYP